MKKLLLIIFISFCYNFVLAQNPIPSNSKYPITQSIGSDSTKVDSKGAFSGRLINYSFTDTTQANTQRIKYYPGAQIFTTDSSFLWIRNAQANEWVRDYASGSGGSGNTSITNIYNNSTVIINVLNDTCLVRCTGSGDCDTVCTNINITSWRALTCSTFQVCGYIPPDTLTQVCDTLTFGTCVPLYIFQNWLRNAADGVVEFGSDQRGFSEGLMLSHNTYTNTNYFRQFWDGYTVYEPPHEFTQQQSFQNGSAVTAFRHYGNSALTGVANPVRMIINYTDSTYQASPYIEGLIGGDRAYTFGTNFRGVAQNAYVDDNNSKTTLIEFHTYDSATTDGVTIIAAPDLGGTPNVFNGLLKNYKTATFNTDGSIKYNRYTGTTFTVVDSSSYKPLVIDANGNMREAYWFGGGGINIYNSDGTILANRTVDADNKNLSFTNAAGFYVTSTAGSDRISVENIYTMIKSPDAAKSYIRVYDDTILLEMTNTSSKLLIPDLAAGSSTDSVMVWSASDGRVRYRNASAFTPVNSDTLNNYWRLTGNLATTGTLAGSFLGTTNNTSLRFRTNNTEKMVLDSNGRLGVGTTAPTFLFETSENNTNTTTAGWKIANAGNGDAVIHFLQNTQNFSIGIDQSNSSRFYISANATLGGGGNGLIMASDGKVGLNGAAPAAGVTLGAGGTGAFSAPLKFSAGSLQNTAEAYAMEVLADSLYYTGSGASRRRLAYAKEIGSFQFDKGANVAAANDLVLGQDGNLFTITGATQINAIATLNWQAGSTISFIFTGAPLVKNNTAGGAGTATLLLAGRTDFQAAAGDYIELQYDGTNWYETNRVLAASVNPTLQQVLTAGSTLTQDNTIVNDANTLTITGNTVAGDPILSITSTSTAAASNLQKGINVSLSGNNATAGQTTYAGYFDNSHGGSTNTNIGVYSAASGGTTVYAVSALAGSGTTSYGVYGQSIATNGSGVVGQGNGTGSGVAGLSNVNTSPAVLASLTTAATNTVELVMRVTKSTSGTAADGIGGKIEYQTETDANTTSISNELISKWTTAANATRSSKFMVTGINSTVTDTLMEIGGLYTLTESSATTFATATIASGSVAGGEIVVTIEANDATDYQARTLRFIWSAVNKAGTTTITLSTPEEVVTASAGTLTATITAADGGSGLIHFQANAVSSLTQTTLRATSHFQKNY